jgi:DNA-binding CsgD family transcriptional regulator
VLLGRTDEMARIERLLFQANGGASSALIVSGDPGIGKTTLLDEAVGRAAGFTVVRTQSLQTESELPFAGLSDLLHPLLSHLDRIPVPQANVLSGAFALGPPTSGDRFAAAAATISLLAAAAEDQPLLVVADDAHWLDMPSREALLFAAHRLGTEGVVILIALRPRPWLTSTRIERLTLDGLTAAAAAELVSRTGRTVGVSVRDRLVAETEGNPMALLQAVSDLDDGQLAGTTPIVGPIAVGADLEQSLAQRLRLLPADTRQALLIVAAEDSSDAHTIGRAMTQAGLPSESLERAELQGLISMTPGNVEFVHPLMRSAAYHLADVVDRRAAHRCLAEAVGPQHEDRVAWHLANAASGSDEEVAALLERAATNAAARHAYAAAARAFAAAARLSPVDDDRLRRTMQGAVALQLSGQIQVAADTLADVLPLATDPLARADLQLQRGGALIHVDPMMDVFALLVAESDLVEPHDPGRAAALLAMASIGAIGAAEVEVAVVTAGRAAELATPLGGPVALLAALALSTSLALAGQVTQARNIVDPLVPLVATLDPLGEGGLLVQMVGHTLAWFEEWDSARSLLERIVTTAREASVVTLLPLPLAILCELEFRCGRMAAAYAAGTESVQVAVEAGQEVAGTTSLVTLARVEAVLGLEADCHEHVRLARSWVQRLGATAMEDYAASALGLLELGLGRPDRAVPHLEECARLESSHGVGHPNVVQAGADLVEALARVGRVDDAVRALATFEVQAEQTGSRWAAASAARCRGLLAVEGEYAGHFERALERHNELDQFEIARTELCLGQRLRRSRRRADARVVLRQSLARFESLGTEPWAEQARAELRATGVAPAPSPHASLTTLTPQELQVALIVAEGATNAEAASSLFISPKTVEFHLSHVYRKLGVRSRTELARRVATTLT